MKKLLILLLGITIIAGVFRFYRLGEIPASLARDEVSAAYNAYAILQTGRDEHGMFLPIAFKAFGDWKLPAEIYLEIPGIALFGLNGFTTRLPEALFGTLSIPLLYFVFRKVIGEKQESLLLFSALFLALSPWHVFMSRAAIGYNVLGLFFFLGGVYFFFSFLGGNKRHLLLSNICFILTLFSYTAFHIFTPLFLVGLVFLYRKRFSLDLFHVLQILLFLLFYIIASVSVLQANAQKVAGTSLWHNLNFYQSEILDKRDTHQNDSLGKVIHNKPLAFVSRLSTNYLSTFSPEFLVTKGGKNPINNVKDMGNMYIAEYILFIIGIVWMFYRKEKFLPFVLLWLTVGAIPAIITTEAPHSTRNLVLVPMLSFIAAYGLIRIISIVRAQTAKVQYAGIVFLIFFICFWIGNIVIFLDNYFVHMAADRGEYWNAGYKEVIVFIEKKNPQKVIMGDQSRSPYIYFLFYEKYDPARYVSEVRRGVPTWDNFEHIDGFSKYAFVENVEWGKIAQAETLYIDRLEKVSKGYPIDGIVTDATGFYRHAWVFTNSEFCTKTFPPDMKPILCL